MRVAILDEKEAADALARSDKGNFTHFLKAAIFHLDGIDRTNLEKALAAKEAGLKLIQGALE